MWYANLDNYIYSASSLVSYTKLIRSHHMFVYADNHSKLLSVIFILVYLNKAGLESKYLISRFIQM